MSDSALALLSDGPSSSNAEEEEMMELVVSEGDDAPGSSVGCARRGLFPVFQKGAR